MDCLFGLSSQHLDESNGFPHPRRFRGSGRSVSNGHRKSIEWALDEHHGATVAIVLRRCFGTCSSCFVGCSQRRRFDLKLDNPVSSVQEQMTARTHLPETVAPSKFLVCLVRGRFSSPPHCEIVFEVGSTYRCEHDQHQD